MRIEAGKEEIIIYSHRCDVCGKEPISRMTCSICGRDICYDCTRFNPREMGDYPTKYCISCFKVGEKYLEQTRIENEKFDNIVEELEQKWRDDAIKAVKGDDKIG